MYTEPQKDSLKQLYVKMSTVDLNACEIPNKFLYIYKEFTTIQTYVPNADCESTLLYPSTRLLSSVCVKCTVNSIKNIPTA